jgi:hypothetical protein
MHPPRQVKLAKDQTPPAKISYVGTRHQRVADAAREEWRAPG